MLNTDKFNFPRSHIDRKKEYMIDIKHPLMIQKDGLLEDMYSYSRKFPINIIPHVTELGEINDIIHNYQQPKLKKEEKQNPMQTMREDEKKDEDEEAEEEKA